MKIKTKNRINFRKLQQITQLNLCGHCGYHPATCNSVCLIFGAGAGNDNVVACAAYKPKVYIDETFSEIQLIQFEAFSGGFATKKTLQWKVVISGVNKEKRTILANTSSREEACLQAAAWCALTGFKLVEYHTKYTTTSELIKQ